MTDTWYLDIQSRSIFWALHWKGPSLKYGTDKSLPGSLPHLLGALGQALGCKAPQHQPSVFRVFVVCLCCLSHHFWYCAAETRWEPRNTPLCERLSGHMTCNKLYSQTYAFENIWSNWIKLIWFMGRISSKETRHTFSEGVGSGGDEPVLIWGVFLVLCFGSQTDVGCGVAMEGTISFPLWYIFCFTLLCHAFLVVSECLWILCGTFSTSYSSDSGLWVFLRCPAGGLLSCDLMFQDCFCTSTSNECLWMSSSENRTQAPLPRWLCGVWWFHQTPILTSDRLINSLNGLHLNYSWNWFCWIV